ncbi:MAG: hypothetical protein AAGA65_08710 [Actinomycetota bacterium]
MQSGPSVSLNVQAGRIGRALLATVLVATLLTALGGVSPAAAQDPPLDNPVLVVTGTGDGNDASGADGVCATNSGNCTLRAAIQQANYNPGTDRIEFGISGSGTKRINIGSTLQINDPTGGLTIDGYTQNGASPNTAANGSNATIRIEIQGSGDLTMILVESAENTLRGLAVFGGDFPIELRGEGSDGNLIVGNFIGTDAAAQSSGTGRTGIELNLGPDQNRVGTPALADRNVIAGYTSQGVRLNHGETSQNRIQNNVIGLSPNGTTDMGGGIGIDVQWWTWGNLIGGYGQNERNVVGGSGSGIDLSHKSTGNLILGNLVGTTLDGNGATNATRNGRGLIVKDDAVGNYFGGNVVAGAENDYAIWHKHNYSAGNIFVENRIGVGLNGSDIGNDGHGMVLRGHDDQYYGNIFANIDGSQNILISNTSIRDAATFEPDEQTVNNAIRVGTYYGNSDSKPIEFGTLCCPHPNEDTPNITGLGPGQINGNQTCANCEVEVYVSGSVNADGTLSPGTGTTGLTWIGTVFADNSGVWSMASPLLTVGSRVRVAGITPSGESSNFSGQQTIPSQGSGLTPNPDQPTTPTPPPIPAEPPIYQPETFECSHAGGTLSWDDVGAEQYFVFATANGTESYLGGHTGTSLSVGSADSYRVEHWARGVATNALCDGDGPPSPFSCSHANGTLSWDDEGASQYFVFATTGGAESYLGGQTGTSVAVAGADSYRVEHWLTGQATNATCDGPGPAQPDPFDCSHSNGTLTWDDAGAAQYFVFATVNAGGGETYLGGHTGTSLAVAGADSYRVEHWLTGQATNATCNGDGPAQPDPFDCSFSNGTLSWDDAGAAQYFVFATTDGTESYLGGQAGTSLAVPAADSYRVEHWLTGQATNATCNGDGPAPAFSCSVAGGLLTWDDAGAAEYYVFATITAGGAETYLGGHTTTSLSVGPADSYRVEHWLAGPATNAICSP